MNTTFWLRHPRLLVRRLRYAAWETTHPTTPWLCPGTVEFLDRHLNHEMTVLEFGSGRSTRWLAQRVQWVVSVEHDHAWHERIAAQLQQDGVANADLRFVLLEHPWEAPEQESYDPLPRYVSVIDEFADRSLGAVLIDGHYRSACIRHVLPKIVAGGYLIVDDAQWWPNRAEMGVPGDWSIVDESTNRLKSALVWQSPIT